MIKVQFFDTDEFLEEVARNAPFIEGSVVRVTREYRQGSYQPIKELYVVATAVTVGAVQRVGMDKPAGRWLLRLDRFCGEVMQVQRPDEISAKAIDRSASIFEKFENQVRALGLVTRPGVFTAEGGS